MLHSFVDGYRYSLRVVRDVVDSAARRCCVSGRLPDESGVMLVSRFVLDDRDLVAALASHTSVALLGCRSGSPSSSWRSH